MKMYEIEELLERAFPKEKAYEWDNVGLLIGRHGSEINTVLTTLDVTPGAVAEAKKCGAELIVSHHPILFGGAKRITDDTAEGKLISELIENKICVYAAHTNCDTAETGINARLAEIFGLTDAEFLEENGLGRIGNLGKAVPLSEFAQSVKEKLGTPAVRIIGDGARIVKRVAVGSGACADSIPSAVEKGADVMVTADLKYHEALDAENAGVCVIDAGHYPTEAVAADIFAEILRGCGLKTVIYRGADVFKYC